LFKGCRNVEAGEKVAKSIRSCGIKGGEVTCFPLDVGSFKSIKKFADLVLNHFPRIDLLVNNGMYMLVIHPLVS
jgi:NAD(P)-dependent dehydrogenase (short-subunit alcohol dehydrogenase family)